MYKMIEKQTSVVTQYGEYLINEGIVTREECKVKIQPVSSGEANHGHVMLINMHLSRLKIIHY
jgi:2-oxoglutarate dehydrogenase complex dehydrogenase (E1) component-like enzyme